MTRRDVLSVLASSCVAGFGVGCSQNSTHQRMSNLTDTSKWEGLTYALKNAREHSQDDHLTSILTNVSTTRLIDHPVGDVSQFVVGPNGNMYILDDSAGVVSAFTEAGKFLSNVGRKGIEPGRYTVATDVATVGGLDLKVVMGGAVRV